MDWTLPTWLLILVGLMALSLALWRRPTRPPSLWPVVAWGAALLLVGTLPMLAELQGRIDLVQACERWVAYRAFPTPPVGNRHLHVVLCIVGGGALWLAVWSAVATRVGAHRAGRDAWLWGGACLGLCLPVPALVLVAWVRDGAPLDVSVDAWVQGPLWVVVMLVLVALVIRSPVELDQRRALHTLRLQGAVLALVGMGAVLAGLSALDAEGLLDGGSEARHGLIRALLLVGPGVLVVVTRSLSEAWPGRLRAFAGSAAAAVVLSGGIVWGLPASADLLILANGGRPSGEPSWVAGVRLPSASAPEDLHAGSHAGVYSGPALRLDDDVHVQRQLDDAVAGARACLRELGSQHVLEPVQTAVLVADREAGTDRLASFLQALEPFGVRSLQVVVQTEHGLGSLPVGLQAEAAATPMYVVEYRSVAELVRASDGHGDVRAVWSAEVP